MNRIYVQILKDLYSHCSLKCSSFIIRFFPLGKKGRKSLIVILRGRNETFSQVPLFLLCYVVIVLNGNDGINDVRIKRENPTILPLKICVWGLVRRCVAARNVWDCCVILHLSHDAQVVLDWGENRDCLVIWTVQRDREHRGTVCIPRILGHCAQATPSPALRVAFAGCPGQQEVDPVFS